MYNALEGMLSLAQSNLGIHCQSTVKTKAGFEALPRSNIFWIMQFKLVHTCLNPWFSGDEDMQIDL